MFCPYLKGECRKDCVFWKEDDCLLVKEKVAKISLLKYLNEFYLKHIIEEQLEEL